MTEMFFWIGACGLPGEDWTHLRHTTRQGPKLGLTHS